MIYENSFNYKSMVSLITDCGEVLIEPHEINTSKFDFDNFNQKISNFNLDNVSNDKKRELACEIIIELIDKEYWNAKDNDFKSKMSEVYRNQVNDLELLVPNFKVVRAIIHYDEASLHMFMYLI